MPTPPRAVPVTPSQHSLLFIHQITPRKDLYNITFRLVFDGRPAEAPVRAALARMLRIQPALRTQFDISGGSPRAEIVPEAEVPLEVHRAPHGPGGWPEVLAAESAAFSRRPLDLGRAPLCAFRLLIGEDRSALLCNVHHTVSDGVSMQMFIDDFVAGYRAALGPGESGIHPQLREEQFVREQEAQVAAAAAAVGGTELTELAGRLREVPPTLLYPAPERPADTGFESESLKVWLSPAQWAALERTARSLRCTPFAMLLSCYSLMLGAHSGNERVVVGSPFVTRRTLAAYDLCGFFVNTLPLVLPGDSGATVADHCREVAEVVREAKRYRSVPFDALVDTLRPDRSANRNPLFQCMFAMQGDLVTRHTLDPGLTVAVEYVSNNTAKFDLWLGATPTEDGLELELEYDLSVFPPSFAHRFLADYHRLLLAAVDDPRATLAELVAPIRADAEPHRSLRRADLTAGEEPDGLHELIARTARHRPDAIAVVEPGRPGLTYGELLNRSESVAAGLHAHGVRAGHVVGLTPRGLQEACVTILAVLRCGAAYLPLDANLPAERLDYMLEQAGARLVLGVYPEPPAGVTVVTPAALLTGGFTETPPSPGPDLPAYVMFTSGSTGRPKGVHMGQRPLLNLLRWQISALGMDTGTRFMQYAQLGFDVSVQEILPTLAAGGAVYGLGDVDRRDFAAVARFVEDAALTHVYLPVAALGAFADASAELSLASVRWLCVSGEQLHLDGRARRLLERLPGSLMNLYGPTETHAVTVHVLTAADAGSPAHVPIGLPLPGVNVYLLDPSGRHVPPGAVGEVYLGGVCPADGYINDADRTATGFLLDPATSTADRPARMYRTGDLAMLTEAGPLVFLGRRDGQVKIRGHRVELGEVEVVAERLPAVSAAAAAVDGTGERAELLLFVRTADGTPADGPAVRAALAATLPGYAVPRYVVTVDTIPLTANGKVDRAALVRAFDRRSARAAATAGTGRWTPGPVEQVVAELWAQHIGVAPAGPDDSFFDLGGNSFEALRFLADLAAASGVQVAAGEFFRAPTVSAVAARVEREFTDSEEGETARVASEEGETARVAEVVR